MQSKNLARFVILAALAALLLTAPHTLAQSSSDASASAASIPQSALIQIDALRPLLKSAGKERPLVLQVGSRVMFDQAHIPGAEYAGPGSKPAGIQSLESVVASLPKDKSIVLYCGCCPWDRCPNVSPAYSRLHKLGFTGVKVLYMANNFGDDWVAKGYPAVKGK
jgi:thiosulfate/3-mercaptopyruvate sulfurtransferase